MKNKIKSTKAKLYNHIHKVKKRHMERFLHTWAHTHHSLIHMGELIIVWVIGAFTMIHASYDSSYTNYYRNSSEEIAQAFTKAIQQQKPKTNQSKIISIWQETSRLEVNNTFFPWYCTRWAALISPEFFPFVEEKTQQRTRWGNAVDRCENANSTWFKIWNNPNVWALIVYKWEINNWGFWHVWKVLYYNQKEKSMIIRDMNRVKKFFWTDRREETNSSNIKCFIYPKWPTNNTDKPAENNNPNNNDKFNINTWNLNTGTIITPTTWSIINTWSNKPIKTWENLTDILENNQKNDSIENNQTHNSAPTKPIVTQEQENNNFYEKTNNIIEEKIIVEPNQKFSDIANHFLSQNEMEIKIVRKNIISIWETILLKIVITNKETKKPYQWILPFILNSISQNKNLEWTLETLQLIHNNENIIFFKAKEIWTSTILLTIDDEKIWTIFVTVQ